MPRRADVPEFNADTEHAHKYRVIAYGFIKLLGVFIYGMLIHWTAQARVTLGFLLVVFLLVGFICAPLHGGLLIYGGFRESLVMMRRATTLCLLIGGYDVFLGIFGFCIFITSLKFTFHFLLMFLFLALALNIIRVAYYDFFLFSAYTKILDGEATTLVDERNIMTEKLRNVTIRGHEEEDEIDEEEEEN